MFRLGFGELLALAVVALVFIRPEDLPALLRRVGRFFGRLSRLRQTFEEEMRAVDVAEAVNKKEKGEE